MYSSKSRRKRAGSIFLAMVLNVTGNVLLQAQSSGSLRLPTVIGAGGGESGTLTTSFGHESTVGERGENSHRVSLRPKAGLADHR